MPYLPSPMIIASKLTAGGAAPNVRVNPVDAATPASGILFDDTPPPTMQARIVLMSDSGPSVIRTLVAEASPVTLTISAPLCPVLVGTKVSILRNVIAMFFSNKKSGHVSIRSKKSLKYFDNF